MRERPRDALSVFDQTLSGEQDPILFEVCQAERRVLVTLDRDFANIQAYPPATTVGIVVLRLVRQDKPRVLQVLKKLIPTLTENAVSQKLWVVEEDRIRIRG